LSFDERVEIGIGEHFARALRAVADLDVAQRARCDVALQRLDRAAEPRCCLRLGEQPIRHVLHAWLMLALRGFRGRLGEQRRQSKVRYFEGFFAVRRGCELDRVPRVADLGAGEVRQWPIAVRSLDDKADEWSAIVKHVHVERSYGHGRFAFARLAFAHRTVDACRARALRSAAVIVRNRAVPPSRPSATAAGFFSISFCGMFADGLPNRLALWRLTCLAAMPTGRCNCQPVENRPTASARIAGVRDGCTEAIMVARGFTVKQMVELVRAVFAAATAERVIAGSRATTDAGNEETAPRDSGTYAWEDGNGTGKAGVLF
jgi:hypothetical protein